MSVVVNIVTLMPQDSVECEYCPYTSTAERDMLDSLHCLVSSVHTHTGAWDYTTQPFQLYPRTGGIQPMNIINLIGNWYIIHVDYVT